MPLTCVTSRPSSVVPGWTEVDMAITGDEFREHIGRLLSGVTVVTTQSGDQVYGTTASAVTSVSLDPPTLLVCMNNASLTGQAIAESGHFSINVLADNQMEIAAHFGRRGSSFDAAPSMPGRNGAPLIEGALSNFECRVIGELVAGTHTIVVGVVEHAVSRTGAPLAYFRGQMGSLLALESVKR
jgi:4-nitrophenol 2-monooxygenase / 4-nitrocatechol 4-monooxygenase, reductase component